jgi:Flp pilus assembly protein TadD
MAEKDSKTFRLEKWIVIGVLVLLPNSGYLAAWAEASIFYLGNVFLHAGLGLLLFVPILVCGWRFLQRQARTGKELAVYAGYAGYWLLASGMALGLYLTLAGVKQKTTLLLYAHAVLSALGVVFLTVAIRRVGHQISINNPINTAGRYLLVFVSLAICIPMLALAYRLFFVRYDDRIHNPHAAPQTMAEEAMGGAQGPFYPSSIATAKPDQSSTAFMLTPETCGEAGCHPDIYRQWQSSAHRFSDFKNLWYRRALTEAEQSIGATSTKWCAGCHSPAALLNGTAQQTQSAPAHAGISCTVCHAIVEVRGTLGQAGFIIEKPKLFDLLASKNPALKKLHAWFVHLDPAPHRSMFRQPFLRNENGAFCSSCHKAHTDAPLNHARWLQIMNDYDSWQDGNFGKADRDFAHVEKRKNCAACHMPFVATHDGEQVRDHRFLGANTLLPILHKDEAQLQATVDFLRDQRITLDLFALSFAPGPDSLAAASERENFAAVEVATVLAPPPAQTLPQIKNSRGDSLLVLGENHGIALARGQSFRLDVIVRSNYIGHNFPGGAADLAQAWLELKIEDERGQTIFWSGATRGEEVDPLAHFYGVEMIDSTGRLTTHERSWEARAARFVNLLPPNSAELVRYRITIPEDCGERISITAKLNYRKYRPAHLQWLEDPAIKQSLGFAESLHVPIVEMARAQTSFAIGAPRTRANPQDTTGSLRAAERWQNYGIGALRQNELAVAERAFRQALRLAPEETYHAINLGAVLLRTGRTGEAKKLFEAALAKNEESARAWYYLGMALKAEGVYRKALTRIKRASELANRDREFRIEIGRLYHLLGDYERAIRSFKRALRIDPEAPEVYYEMMNTYRARGDPKSAARVEKLYLRFRKDESMKVLEEKFSKRGESPHVYHEHGSAHSTWLRPAPATNGRAAAQARQ